MTQLFDAMSIQKGRFYATFGSKRDVFPSRLRPARPVKNPSPPRPHRPRGLSYASHLDLARPAINITDISSPRSLGIRIKIKRKAY